MATRRKPAARRATAAKIRVHTDEYGRKVYTVVGTKKYAYTLAKAKELAAKKAPKKRAAAKPAKKRASSKKSTALTTTRKRTTVAKRKPTTRRRTTGAKRNAKGQFVKAGRKTARRVTRRNALKKPSAHMARTRAARTAKLDDRNARLIQSDAMYDVYSNLYTKGLTKPRTGKSVGEAEGKREAVRLAEAYIAEQGVGGMLYREDVGNSVIYRGKEGSGIGGMIEIYPMNDDEVLDKYAGMKFTALTRRNAKRRKSKRGLSGITLAQTKTVARNILREVSGEDPMSEYGRKAIARDVKRAGVITGLTAESAYMEGGVDETMLPASLRGKGYFDFDNAHRMFWTKM